MMDALPIYYLPPGVARPSCCIFSGGSHVDGTGPDGKTGGTMIGGGYRPGDPQWIETAAGWWMRVPLGLRPQALRKLRVAPIFSRWTAVPGNQEGHAWAVPIIIQPIAGKDDATSWVPAVDRVLTSTGWTLGEADHLADRLLMLADGRAVGVRDIEWLTTLAIDLLSIGHAVNRDLIASLRWLSEQVVMDVCVAATGVPDGSP